MLAALTLLKERYGSRALVIAPRIVATQSWPAEIAKWAQFAGLTYAIAHGAKRDQVIREHADKVDVMITTIDVVDKFFANFPPKQIPKSWPWDVLIVDESSKFKNPSSVRFKTLKHYHALFPRRWILTGTPAPNSLLDLWSQIYLIDSGAALGKNITSYRREYFDDVAPRSVRFSIWRPKAGAPARIHNAIAPLVMRVDESTFPDLPPLVVRDWRVTLPDKARGVYDKIEKEFFAEVDGGAIEAPTAVAKYNLCRQIANGRAYCDGGVMEIHAAKDEMIDNLLDELQGKPVIIAYHYRHDLTALEVLCRRRRSDYAVIGGGVSVDDVARTIERWNKGDLPVLLAHPASMSHGLNLQGGGSDLVFYSLTDNLDNYQQIQKRLHRRGQRNQVRVHRVIAAGTIDEALIGMMDRKGETQRNLLDAVRLYRDKFTSDKER
jgi:SNF2 family DNA or RNA helicase